MSAVFTEHAVERMKELADNKAERGNLATLLSTLEAIRDVTDLVERPETVPLGAGGQSDVFLVRSGSMRAVVRTDRDQPDLLTVMSVYVDEPREATAALHSSSTLHATARVG